MIPSTDCKSTERNQDWIARLYVEEVWAYLYPNHRRRTAPVNEQFLGDVERCYGEIQDVGQFRRRFADVIRAYAWAGIRYKWNSDPQYKGMFAGYLERHGTAGVTKGTARLTNMRELSAYVQEWVAEAAYYIWEAEGRPTGREDEHWGRAHDEFLEAHT